MNKKIVYTDPPKDIAKSLDRAVIVKDTLPTSEQFMEMDKKEKTTIAIDKASLDAYRNYAKKHNAKYQTMINKVVPANADEHLVKK